MSAAVCGCLRSGGQSSRRRSSKNQRPLPGLLSPCSVAAVVPRKGHLDLLDALARLREVDWRLRLVGTLERDRDHTRAVADRIEELGLGEIHYMDVR